MTPFILAAVMGCAVLLVSYVWPVPPGLLALVLQIELALLFTADFTPCLREIACWK